MGVKFYRLSFPKSLKWLPSLPSRFLTSYVWRARWLKIIAASGGIFSESVAVGAEFCFREDRSTSISE
jgi:hypothetical protein